MRLLELLFVSMLFVFVISNPVDIASNTTIDYDFINSFNEVALTALKKANVILPQTGLNSTGLINFFGYPVEVHEITTVDGYCLQVHRIPYGKNRNVKGKPVVLMAHCLFCDSSFFVAAGPGKALALLFADEGYDVWLINFRGTSFSRKHLTIDPDLQPERFFNYSLTEKGKYDIPAVIDFILEKTGQTKIKYVGYSEGGTTFTIFASSLPHYNEKIEFAILLAPAVYLQHLKQELLLRLSQIWPLLLKISELTRIYEIPHSHLMGTINVLLCNKNSPSFGLCKSTLDFGGGMNTSEVDTSFLPVAAYNFPEGISIKELAHLASFVKSGRFSDFDYASSGENLVAYGTEMPPEFPISNINIKIGIYYGISDSLISPIDIKRFALELPNIVFHKLMKMGHFDFLLNKYVVERVYKSVIADFASL